ncbi:hypothetical protein GOBAR_DD14315 [Gossypium barbadense]|nr:hypothetical protein GOBAR_DD14315 [Gossypium barbadense]
MSVEKEIDLEELIITRRIEIRVQFTALKTVTFSLNKTPPVGYGRTVPVARLLSSLQYSWHEASMQLPANLPVGHALPLMHRICVRGNEASRASHIDRYHNCRSVLARIPKTNGLIELWSRLDCPSPSAPISTLTDVTNHATTKRRRASFNDFDTVSSLCSPTIKGSVSDSLSPYYGLPPILYARVLSLEKHFLKNVQSRCSTSCTTKASCRQSPELPHIKAQKLLKLNG